MEPLRACLLVLRKDLLLGWRGRARAAATAGFGITTLLLFSFAVGPDVTLLRVNAGGFLWLAVLLASTLQLGESFRAEREHGAMDALLLLPVPAAAVFYGKAVAVWGLLALFSLGLVPVSVALFDLTITMGIGPLAGILLLGTAGIAAPGTMYAALSGRARAQDVLLPLLLFPLLVPTLLAAVKATTLVLSGDPMGQLASWASLLAVFDLVYWPLCGLLFPFVVED
jgi:heme exporter protein B